MTKSKVEDILKEDRRQNLSDIIDAPVRDVNPFNHPPQAQRDAQRDPTTGRFLAGAGGRPKGAKNKMTAVAKAVLSDNTGAIVQKCVDLALAGDTGAMKICMDRILPVGVAGKLNRGDGGGIAVNIVVENLKDIEGKVVG